MARRFILVVVAIAVLAPVSLAQRRAGFHGAGRGARDFERSFGHHRDGVPRGYFLGDTAFLYEDYPFAPAVPEPEPPQFVVMQPPAAPDPPPVKIASLLIELQGDRYVRYGGVPRSTESETPGSEMPFPREASGQAAAPHLARPDLPATVLVYRDGHREEAADYAIVGRVMYAHKGNSHNGQTGYELNNIPLSALDIPATVAANRENGVNFVLPGGPNEVVTRP